MTLTAPVRRFVRRLIGWQDTEEDIVQNVFVSLYYNMHRIQPVENLRPYLFRMVRNACYDELRSQRRFESVDLDEEPQRVWLTFTGNAALDDQPEEAAHWVLLQMEVEQAIQQLPEAQRQTLLLYAYEELSYAEIAVAMDVNIGTVKSRLFNAKKMLRRLLRPQTVQLLDTELGDQDVEL